MPWVWLFALTFHYGVSRGFFHTNCKTWNLLPTRLTESRKPTLFQMRCCDQSDTARSPRHQREAAAVAFVVSSKRRLKYFSFLAALNHCQTWYTALQNWKGGRHSGKSCRPDISRAWSQPLSTPDVLAHLQSCQIHSAIPHCQEMRKTDTEPNLRDYGSSFHPPCAHFDLTAARGSLAESVRYNPG